MTCKYNSYDNHFPKKCSPSCCRTARATSAARKANAPTNLPSTPHHPATCRSSTSPAQNSWTIARGSRSSTRSKTSLRLHRPRLARSAPLIICHGRPPGGHCLRRAWRGTLMRCPSCRLMRMGLCTEAFVTSSSSTTQGPSSIRMHSLSTAQLNWGTPHRQRSRRSRGAEAGQSACLHFSSGSGRTACCAEQMLRNFSRAENRMNQASRPAAMLCR